MGERMNTAVSVPTDAEIAQLEKDVLRNVMIDTRNGELGTGATAMACKKLHVARALVEAAKPEPVATPAPTAPAEAPTKTELPES